MSVLLNSFKTPDNLGFTVLMNRGKETDVIYLDCKKHLTLSHVLSFSLNWKDMGLMDGLLEKNWGNE